MPRALRIEYPGALYHILNRGNNRARIFEEDSAKKAFQTCLLEACERAGWRLHAYCLMDNHYHLAIETPEPNLSEGMRWLQSAYANRYNRFRKESGHLFQGRFKSLLVGDWDRLAWLCHYIHLNPVRAGICDVAGLKSYEFSSYWHLRKTRTRKPFMNFDTFLEGAGGLSDTDAGRAKYESFLARLNEDDVAKEAALFDRMSRGWAIGTKDFKRAVVAGERDRLAAIETGGKDHAEIRQDAWDAEAARCMKILGKKKAQVAADRKAADWKVAIATHLKATMLCKNPWLGERLNMGSPAGISRYCSELQAGKRKAAAALLKRLS